MMASKRLLHFDPSVVLVGLFGTNTALAQPKKPNNLVIWCDELAPGALATTTAA